MNGNPSQIIMRWTSAPIIVLFLSDTSLLFGSKLNPMNEVERYHSCDQGRDGSLCDKECDGRQNCSDWLGVYRYSPEFLNKPTSPLQIPRTISEQSTTGDKIQTPR